MRRAWIGRLLAAVVLAGGMTGGPALAQPAAAQATSDRQAVLAALDALNRGGYAGIEPHIAGLRGVLDRAPAGAVVGSETAMVYGMAAMILMMQANEQKRYADAAAYGERGLRLMPDDDRIVTETATAYAGLKRPADGLRLIDRWLARPGPADTHAKARMLRARGFALVELDRLDEAEQAYRDALKLEPDHRGAQNELTYIQGLREGKAKTQGVTTTYDKAKAGTYEDPPKR